MEIEITRKDFTYLLAREKVIWKDYVKSRFSLFCILAIAGGLCLADAIDGYTKNGHLTNITFSLAIGFLLTAFLHIGYALLVSQQSIKRARRLVEQYKKYPEPLTIQITAWGITTKALDATCEFSWSYFTSCKIAASHLFILPNHHSLANIFIDKEELPVEQYNQLVTFLNNRFPKKK